MIFSDKKSSFGKLLSKDHVASIHFQNIQKLGVNMFEVVKDGNPERVNGFLVLDMNAFISFDESFLSYLLNKYCFQQ